jgi:hypothetical protein
MHSVVTEEVEPAVAPLGLVSVVESAVEAPECLLSPPSDGMARRPVDPSRPVVRPDCSHTLLMSHMSQHPFGLVRAAPLGRISRMGLSPFGADNVAR